MSSLQNEKVLDSRISYAATKEYSKSQKQEIMIGLAEELLSTVAKEWLIC
jgi:hypothetical protein